MGKKRVEGKKDWEDDANMTVEGPLVMLSSPCRPLVKEVGGKKPADWVTTTEKVSWGMKAKIAAVVVAAMTVEAVAVKMTRRGLMAGFRGGG
mmetsp:Transcript_82654/g.165202  ORF Transcript_82654/g.165202 Transcript_82654/m.165202 type:complete len:92 (+) Transcript_82654:979-1254(+)